jgi:hypothetical protein
MDSYEAEELGRYTSLSSLAICAFLLGIASLVALLAPLMVVIPIAGIVVALFALVRIGRSDGALSGRTLAVIGLGLAIACGIASPLRVKVRDSLYSSQAEQAGRQWLEAVSRDEITAALDQTTGNAKGNLMGPPSAGGEPAKYDPQTSKINFGSDPLVTKLRDEATHGELKFVAKALTCDVSGAVPRVAVTYQTTEPDDSLTMNLVLLRSPSAGGWLVDSWRLEGETEHDHAHPHVH